MKANMCKAIQSCDYHARHAFWPCIKVELDSRCASYCSEMRRINTYVPMTCQHWYGKLIGLHAARMDFLFQLVQPRRSRTDLPLAPQVIFYPIKWWIVRHLATGHIRGERLTLFQISRFKVCGLDATITGKSALLPKSSSTKNCCSERESAYLKA